MEYLRLRRGIVIFAAFWLVIGGGGPTHAQQAADGPIRLLPTVPPTPKLPDAETGAATAQGQPVPADQGIAVVALEQFDPSSVGVLSLETGGFDVTLWSGARREMVEGLLPHIPALTPSRVAQSLRRRLLLTAAKVPSGPATAPSFLGLRVERLAAAGDYASATALAALAPPQMDDPALDIARADGALLDGNHQAACEIVDRSLALGRRAPYWVRRFVFCRVLDGDVEHARLTSAILRELPGDPDPLFDRLLATLVDGSDVQIEPAKDVTPLHFAMIRAARRAIPDSAANSDNPALLRAIATSANASIEARLMAGEAAEVVGSLSAESLGQIYASLAFSDDQRANVLTAALELPRPLANALLFQSAVGEDIPAAQAEALQTALKLANARTHGMVARVNADRLVALTPDPDLVWFAADAGLALLHAGAVDGARGWFDLARLLVSETQADAAVAVLKLWPPLMVLPPSDPLPWVSDAVVAWWQGIVELDSNQMSNLGGTVLSVFDAVGLAVPDPVWEQFTKSAASVLAERPSVGVLRGLHAAAQGGRVGETVLFALVALGDKHPAEVDAVVLADVVAALLAVGLRQDALALALEAVVGRSL